MKQYEATKPIQNKPKFIRPKKNFKKKPKKFKTYKKLLNPLHPQTSHTRKKNFFASRTK